MVYSYRNVHHTGFILVPYVMRYRFVSLKSALARGFHLFARGLGAEAEPVHAQRDADAHTEVLREKWAALQPGEGNKVHG